MVREFLQRARSGSPLLFATASVHLALIPLFLVLTQFDDRSILGIDPWIKPLKFAISITIFSATMAWLLSFVAKRFKRWIISGVISAAMFTEIVCIAGQSWRGVPSHFNVTTSFDGAIFSLMGFAISMSTGFVAYTGLLLRRHGERTLELEQRPLLSAGLSAGIVVFLFGSVIGAVMAGMLRHTIGAADGGPGLPLVNWSTVAGDLRVAHFLGLHALQALPLCAWLLEGRESGRAIRWVWLAGVGYALAVALLLALALLGLPVIPLPG